MFYVGVTDQKQRTVATANVHVSCISAVKEWSVSKTAATWKDVNAASVVSINRTVVNYLIVIPWL